MVQLCWKPFRFHLLVIPARLFSSLLFGGLIAQDCAVGKLSGTCSFSRETWASSSPCRRTADGGPFDRCVCPSVIYNTMHSVRSLENGIPEQPTFVRVLVERVDIGGLDDSRTSLADAAASLFKGPLGLVVPVEAVGVRACT